MQALERAVERMWMILSDTSAEETRRLQRVLKEPRSDLIAFGVKTLEQARILQPAPDGHLDLLEHVFETWWGHSLATKLAVIGWVARLSDEQSWPDDTPEGRIVNDVIARAGWITDARTKSTEAELDEESVASPDSEAVPAETDPSAWVAAGS